MMTFKLDCDFDACAIRVVATNKPNDGSWNDGRRFRHYHEFDGTPEGEKAAARFVVKVINARPTIDAVETSAFWDEAEPVLHSAAWQMMYEPNACC